MERKTFNKEDLVIAELKFYDRLMHGVEVMEPLSHAILCVKDGEYVNVLNPEDNYPLYRRNRCYARHTAYGDVPYVEHVWGPEEDGPCYLITDSMPYDMPKEVSLEEIESYVVNSHDFYKDRAILYFNMMMSGNKDPKLPYKYKNDVTQREFMMGEISSRERENGSYKNKTIGSRKPGSK